MTADPNQAQAVTAEMVMAYADGALSPAAAAKVEAAMAADPALAMAVARHHASRAAAAAAVAPILEAPIPARLLAAARAGGRSARPSAWKAGAAGLALAASFAAGFVLAPKPPSTDFLTGADGLIAGGALATALQTQASGAEQDGIKIALTVPAQGGGVCRAFSSERGGQAQEGVACQDPGGWRIVALAQAEAGEPGAGYRTAAGALGPAMLIALEQRRAGDPLGADEERAAIAAGFAAVQ